MKIIPLQCGQRFVKAAIYIAIAICFVVEAVLSPCAVGPMFVENTVRRAMYTASCVFSITCGEDSLDCAVCTHVRA